MKTTLSINIKRLRKEKKMTQEQLAQAMNVTIGAVYKWEQDLSTPDLNTIMDLARFFSLSVDALIGYDALNNTIDKDLVLLQKYVNNSKYNEAIELGERLIALHPNNFDVLYNCGLLYEHYVYENGNEDDTVRNKYIDRALELLFKAQSLINESDRPQLNSYNISSYISECYFEKKEYKKAIDILENINYEGINNYRIAEIMVMNDGEESKIKQYMSDSLLLSSNYLLNSLLLMIYYCDNDDYNLKRIIDFTINYIILMKNENGISYMDKSLGFLYFRKAILMKKNNEDYLSILNDAKNSIVKYDSIPSYSSSETAISFFEDKKRRIMDDGGSSSLSLIDDYISTNKIDEDLLNEWAIVLKK